MTVTVLTARIPAYSSIGILTGTDEEGNTVTLAVDHGPARYICEELAYGELVVVTPESWQILSVTPRDEVPYHPRQEAHP